MTIQDIPAINARLDAFKLSELGFHIWLKEGWEAMVERATGLSFDEYEALELAYWAEEQRRSEEAARLDPPPMSRGMIELLSNPYKYGWCKGGEKVSVDGVEMSTALMYAIQY